MKNKTSHKQVLDHDHGISDPSRVESVKHMLSEHYYNGTEENDFYQNFKRLTNG